MPEEVIGKVTDFFARPVVAGIELTATLKVGDKIHIKGHTTDLEVVVDSMQINNVNVDQAKSGVWICLFVECCCVEDFNHLIQLGTWE